MSSLRIQAVGALAISLFLGLVLTGCVGQGKSHPCDPIPNGTAVCLNGKPVSGMASVEVEDSQYFAPLEELAATLGAQAVMSPDKRHITINGKELSTTNGSTNTLERNGKVYVIILDAANAAGFQVVINFNTHTVNILK